MQRKTFIFLCGLVNCQKLKKVLTDFLAAFEHLVKSLMIVTINKVWSDEKQFLKARFEFK